MVLFQKLPFFQLFFFRHYRPGKCLLRYSRTKKHLCSLEKQKVRKDGNIGEENVFWDILKGKNAFLGYKEINKTFKKVEKLTYFQRG